MKKATLEQMQVDSTLSEIQRMAAGCLIDSRKKNGHRDLGRAEARLETHYPGMSFDDRLEYVTEVAEEADNREWRG